MGPTRDIHQEDNMSTFPSLPHVREPIKTDPDVCIHCRMPWCDLFTGPTDECPARLREALDRLLTWRTHPNNRHVTQLVIGSGEGAVVLGEIRAGFSRNYGHYSDVHVGTWSESGLLRAGDGRRAVLARLGIPVVRA